MASLQKTDRSPFWLGSYLDGGKWRLRSTKATDKKEAQKILDAWEEAAATTPASSIQARQVVLDIMEAKPGAGKCTISVRAFTDKWLNSIQGTMKKASYISYVGSVSNWLRYLGASAEQDICIVTQAGIENWRNNLAEGVSVATANKHLSAIRRVLAAAVDEEYIRHNPTKKVRSLRATVSKYQKLGGEIISVRQSKNRRAFTMQEIATLDGILTPEWRTIMWMGFFTGQRLGDILTFEWSDISFPHKSLHLVTAKTGRNLWLPAPPELLNILSAWKEQQPERERFLFPKWAAGIIAKDGNACNASNRFALFLWKARLRTHTPKPWVPVIEQDRRRENGGTPQHLRGRRRQQELCFHSLRYTARTAMEEAGVPKAVIDAFIGHDGRVGERYTTVGENALRLAAAVLSDRAAGKTVDPIAPGAFMLRTVDAERHIKVAS